ncbi:MAG TPA: regulatory iron-sulfur-containing complex subunit RicT [Polyangia bacterium]|jgi:cell fate regulator YaaT (PSP1 superfamily)|nr:regulatory iron-sulfur-containing complex subunit RicT [Polyangia bacterium]
MTEDGEREDPGNAADGGAAAGRPVNSAGVKLHPTGRTYEVDAGPLALRRGQQVMIQGEHGPEIGTVAVPSALRPAAGRLPRVVRIADQRDLERLDANRRRATEALAFGRERVRARKLPVKMFRAELHPNGKATFYFASENRIDFRELVRDLSNELRLRVELRQVGVRDEAKMVGGIGSCGRELCCTTFLPRFAPVSIKMAKHQNLVLNPTKVSGQCGRLKCCLVYEEANYVEASKLLPKVGKRVSTPEGEGRVGDLDVLHGRVRVYFQDQPPQVFSADQVRALAPPAGAHAPSSEPDPGDEPPPGVPHD